MRLLSLLAIFALASPALSEERDAAKPPLTKEQEREKFHPPGPWAWTPPPGWPASPGGSSWRRPRPWRPSASGAWAPRSRAVASWTSTPPAARPDTLLVAFGSGGLWRSDNRGSSWTSLFDDQSSMTIGDFAIADPEGQVIWVGSGENNSSRTSYAGTGIFKSTDGGKTWSSMGLTDSHHIGRIVVDARNPDTVQVAALGHLPLARLYFSYYVRGRRRCAHMDGCRVERLPVLRFDR